MRRFISSMLLVGVLGATACGGCGQRPGFTGDDVSDEPREGEGEGEGEGEPPCAPDSDDDGLCDAREVQLGTDPADADSDDDGLADGAEVQAGTDPLDVDSDDDGLPDGDEQRVGTDPLVDDRACISTSAAAFVGTPAPVDIIIAIDSSGSMEGEIDAVERNISSNFADIIGGSGVDYRVILLADYPPPDRNFAVCIGAPLSTDDCLEPLPAAPGTRFPTFFHYDTFVGSHDAFEKILSTYSTPDPHGQMPSGWGAVLRKNSFKAFLLISDDAPNLLAADFDAQLLALSAEDFGTAQDRRYVWHSIIGMAENDPPTSAWAPTDPIRDERCSPGSESSATEYQALSVLTGGLRFPLCDNDSFDVVFRAIAAGVIEQVRLPCALTIPEPPAGTVVALEDMAVIYAPGDGEAPRSLRRVDDATACVGDGFFIESGVVSLCPDTCAVALADDNGILALHAACPEPNEPQACTECSCESLACIDGTCAPCTDSNDCCPGFLCADDGVCFELGG